MLSETAGAFQLPPPYDIHFAFAQTFGGGSLPVAPRHTGVTAPHVIIQINFESETVKNGIH